MSKFIGQLLGMALLAGGLEEDHRKTSNNKRELEQLEYEYKNCKRRKLRMKLKEKIEQFKRNNLI